MRAVRRPGRDAAREAAEQGKAGWRRRLAAMSRVPSRPSYSLPPSRFAATLAGVVPRRLRPRVLDRRRLGLGRIVELDLDLEAGQQPARRQQPHTPAHT